MATEHDQNEVEGLDDEELEQQHAEELPDREVMTILPIDPTAPAKVLPLPTLPVVEEPPS
jgi:hypothetical protein